jgi:ribose transport system ATP-binding protein
MTVAENIWLTHEPLRVGITLRRREMRQRTQALIDLFRGTISSRLHPDALVNTLPPDERQIVEILKALSAEPRLIILDEATASLDTNQVNRLFELIQEWKARGMAVIMITHRMEEIFRVADLVTVLRNGRWVNTVPIEQTTEREVVTMMIEGAPAPADVKITRSASHTSERLRVTNLRGGRVQNVSFALHDGELLGLGGLHGQGQEDLLLALFGAIAHSGSVTLGGQPVHFKHPQQAMRHGIAYVPGDRANEGLLLIRSILENFQLPSWRKYGALIRMGRARRDALDSTQELQLVYNTLDAPVSSLSGGNAQKVVIGKWLLRKPTLLLLNDPTKGVDVGAKGEFYALLKELAAAGTAILFYSSDDDELLGLCDRLLVLQDGQVRAELQGDQLTRANLVAASVGSVQHG